MIESQLVCILIGYNSTKQLHGGLFTPSFICNVQASKLLLLFGRTIIQTQLFKG